ncbi:DedA family protein [Planobispora siamensis]|uniref:VTT domain-containing protein n=1 Tax=Planobispora siamensis TaxID=936338 RepID=A0A8J3SK50_9ACTN|nr:VTT domain-containing protein [Planobispora siamensis]GIH91108.1 hypothetical protein Psi01_17380 [Planobispora siamensis]
MYGVELPAVAVLAYLVISVLTAFDVFFPVIPGEGTLMAAGALTVTGDLEIPLVILAGAAGALAGDLASYQAGARLRGLTGARRSTRVVPGRMRRAASGAVTRALPGRMRRAVPGLVNGWPERFHRHGPLVLVAARLVPGGRTAATLAAGRLAYPRRRFALTELAVDTAWATAATLLGFLGASVLPANLTPERLLLIAEAVLLVVCLTLGVRLWRTRLAYVDALSVGQDGDRDGTTRTG